MPLYTIDVLNMHLLFCTVLSIALDSVTEWVQNTEDKYSSRYLL